MSVFESINNTSKNATDIAKKYATSSVDYIKLKTFYVTTLSISLVTKIVVVGGLLTIGLLFMSVSLAIILGDYFESLPIGCLLVGGIYVFLGLIAFLARKTIDKKIIQRISLEFFKK
jgi:ABC-type Mn2+/Zn2+ transport system permease subunit